MLEPALLEYIVVHELAHTDFWRLMSQYLCQILNAADRH